MTENNDNGPARTSYESSACLERTPVKTFKACRPCRRLKMRCEGNENPPCKRCTSSGAECIFDLVESSRKRKHAEEDELREEMRKLQRHVASLAAERTAILSNHHPDKASFTDSPKEQQLYVSVLRDEDGLSPEQLSAPVSAVHDLAPNCSPQTSFVDTHRNDSNPGSIGFSQKLNRTSDTLLESMEDVVTKNFIEEDQARRLFNIYMNGSNPYLPLFEPTLDTFDKIRRTSTFLFTCILSVVGRTEHDMEEFSRLCRAEADLMAAQSLFNGPAPTETVQALIILAAWSEKSWFALAHAVNMALDVGLDKVFSSVLDAPRRDANTTVAQARDARTWLILFHLEREIAFGTARKSRFGWEDETRVSEFLRHPHFRHLDLRFMSIISLLQTREKWQKVIESSNSLPHDAPSLLQDAKEELGAWERTWSQYHKEHSYDDTSFQRTSLSVQRNYATVLVYCAVLSMLQRQKSTEAGDNSTLETFSTLSRDTLIAVIDHLQFMTDKAAFRWHLKYSPTYSALTITFSTALALTLAKTYPEIARERYLISISRSISTLLAGYPNQKFHLLVESSLNRHHQPPAQLQSANIGVLRNSNMPPEARDTQVTDGTANAASTPFRVGRDICETRSLPQNPDKELHDSQFVDPADTFQDKELEFILGLPAESWFFDPVSADAFSFDGP